MIPGSKGLPPHEPAQVRVNSNLNSYTKKEKKVSGIDKCEVRCYNE